MYECYGDGQAGLGTKCTYLLECRPAFFWGGAGWTGRGRNRFIWKALECSDNKSFYLLFHLSSGNEWPIPGLLEEG